MTTAPDPRATWWFWRPVQERLATFAQALIAPLGARYTVIFRAAGTGYHDPQARVIHANPALFADEPVLAQFRATQGILAHEAAHALYTGAWPEAKDDLLCELVNILEDARIENAIGQIYPGIVPALRLLGDLLLARLTPEESEAPWQVVACCLAWRWAHDRAGEKAMLRRLKVGADGAALWATVRPLVEDAWAAPDTAGVIELARRVLEALGLPPGRPIPEWLKTLAPPTGIPKGRREAPLTPGEPVPASPPLGSGAVDPALAAAGDEHLEPAPYVEMENAARPLARQLAEALRLPEPRQAVRPHAWRGRFSVRQRTRTPETPCLHRDAPGRAARSLALYVLVDRSGSMGVLQDKVRLALMMLYLAATDLRVPIGLTAFGADTEEDEAALTFALAELSPAARELAKALIAGYAGNTSYEFLDWGLRLAEAALASRPERRKVVIVIHDGQPVYHAGLGCDWDLALERLRGFEQHGLLPIGIYLGGRDEDLRKLRVLFRHLIVCAGVDPPERLGDLLRGLAGG